MSISLGKRNGIRVDMRFIILKKGKDDHEKFCTNTCINMDRERERERDQANQ